MTVSAQLSVRALDGIQRLSRGPCRTGAWAAIDAGVACALSATSLARADVLPRGEIKSSGPFVLEARALLGLAPKFGSSIVSGGDVRVGVATERFRVMLGGRMGWAGTEPYNGPYGAQPRGTQFAAFDLGVYKYLEPSARYGAFVGGGLNQLTGDPTYPASLVDQAKERYGLEELPRSTDLVRLNGLLMVAGGAALALGVAPRRSALLLAALLQPTNVVGHAFWTMDDERKAFAERNHFLSNVAITGGLLAVASD